MDEERGDKGIVRNGQCYWASFAYTSNQDGSYTKEEQLQEYALCKKYLEEITGTAIEAVSYPCNSIMRIRKAL